MDFGSILGVFLKRFFGTFLTSRKMMHPTKVLQIAVKSWVGRLRKQATFDRESYEKIDAKLLQFFDAFLPVLGVILEGFWRHLGCQKPSKNRTLFFDREK